MSKPEEFKLLKIQTVVLKVHIHCDGCRQEVKKLLQKIEGVYTVIVDAEHQKVTVSGNVDSSALIKKLARSGKHAELWSQKPYSNSSSSNNNNQIKKFNQQQQQQQQQQGKDASKNKINDKNNQAFIQGLKDFKNQHNTIESCSSDDEAFDDDDYGDEDDYDEDDDHDEQLGILADKLKQFNLLKQQPRNPAAAAAAAAAANSMKTCSNNGGGTKGRGNNLPSPAPIGMKPINGLQPKVFPMAPNHKVIHNGAPLAKVNVEGKMGNGLMNLSSLQALNGTNGFGSHQAQHQQHPQLPANFPTGYPAATGGNGGLGMMNMRGINSGSSSSSNNDNNMLLMNESRYMQPQVMCNRSPQIPPYTGYCYPYPYPYPYYRSPYVSHYPETGGYGDHLFSDENTSSCVVM